MKSSKSRGAMGIGNDIKPKKVYRYKPHHHNPYHVNEHEKDEPAKMKLDTDRDGRYDGPEKVEDLEDDFFHDYNKAKPKKTKEKKGDSGGFLFQNLNAKNITWLLLIALVVIVFYQNFDSIKGIFVTNTTSKNSNSEDEYYEGVTNKNSNVSTNVSTNTNRNSNGNINVNTNNTAAPVATDKSDITLKVLNGNGVAGSADEVSATLKAAGFSPAKSANARKFTYAESIIYYKTGEENAANLVKAALPNLATTIENSDSIVGTFDVIVVVGKR